MPIGTINILAFLSIKLFINTLTIWATSILVQFLVNYVLGWRAWIEEEEEEKIGLDLCPPRLLLHQVWLTTKQS